MKAIFEQFDLKFLTTLRYFTQFSWDWEVFGKINLTTGSPNLKDIWLHCVTMVTLNTPHPKLWSIPSKSVDINLLYYVLVRRILYLKLEGVNAIPRCRIKRAIYKLNFFFAIYTQHLTMTRKHFVRLETNDTYSDAWSLPDLQTMTFIYLVVFTGAMAVSY